MSSSPSSSVSEEDPDFNPRFKTIILNKWTSTVASIWIQCTSGSLYTFSIYSEALKASQAYDQSTLDLVSVFKDFGANTGVLSGLLYSSTVDNGRRGGGRCGGGGGPWVVLLAGAVQCFVGYFLMWLTVAGVLPRPPVLVMCLYMLLAAHAMTFFNTANVVTGVINFPNYKGTIVGIMKGFLGLSGAILIQVYQTIFRNRPTAHLLMLAILPTLNSLLFMSFVGVFRRNELEEKKHLNGFSFLALVTAAYLTFVILIKNLLTLRLAVRISLFVVLVLLLVSPISIALKALREKYHRKVRLLLERNELVYEPNQLYADTLHSSEDPLRYHELPGDPAEDTDRSAQVTMLENLNLLQAMCTSSFWFLFFTTACGMGSGLATVNNISQIGRSLGYMSLETSTLVSLWSIWNFLGRFGAGYVSDYFLHVKGWSRPVFIAVTLAAMTVGHAVIASGMPGALYAGSILVGVCYGSQWSLMPTVASEVFGKAHFGTIFNTITIAGPVGSYIFSVKVIGYIYDKQASGERNICTGTHCFMLSFSIMASATFIGSLVALALFFRTRNFYKRVIVRRLSLSKRIAADID